MEIQFSASQTHQQEAVGAIVQLFAGQPGASSNEFSVDGAFGSLTLTERGLANNLQLDATRLLENCRQVQAGFGLPQSDALTFLTLASGERLGTFPNFTIEMETGTGKTYAYLQSIYELNKQYGFKKFVVVVPSIAIREGVLKNLRITHAHFQALYDHEPCAFSVYDSSKVSELRNFALSTAIEILVINIDSFSKDSTDASDPEQRRAKGNVINQLRESGVRPIEFIQATNPIVIMDEPQNMETDLRKQAIARLRPVVTLRYSATPRDAYDLVYQLDPIRAFELGLVKQIGVDSVVEGNDANQAYIELEGFRTGKKSVSAQMKIWASGPSGPVKRTVTARNGSDLFTLSDGRQMYKDGFIVNEIDAGEAFVKFANDVTVRHGTPHGALTDTILRLQIDATVRRHFEKQARLRPLNIKVLSVIFIDRVASYRVYSDDGSWGSGKFATWFENSFAKYRAKPEFEHLYTGPADAVHNGYFAKDRRGRFKDSSERGSQDDDETYRLIMQDKERLLNPAEPLCFIFSHSALREGWDNPNVFQICTLAEGTSDVKKRQEIGRGLRLAVNANGERILDRHINRLTIIANESYEEFAQALQTEMEQQGVAFKKEMLQNERTKVTVRLKKGFDADEKFRQLWKRISERTRYRVSYSTPRLITDAVSAVKNAPAIERPKVVIARADLAIGGSGVRGTEVGRRTEVVQVQYIMPDLLSQIQSRTSLSRSTVAAVLLQSDRLGEALNDPQAFIDQVSGCLNDVKRALLVEGVEYVKVDGFVYEMHRFQSDDVMELFETNVVAVAKQEKTLFSHIVIDSGSGPEQAFAKACEDNDDVNFYIKLPRWFTIETPVGPYNPDWALVYRNDQTLYLVAETKNTGGGAVDLAMLRPLERLKIQCGKQHFKQFEEVRFRVVKTLSDLIA